MCVNPWLKKVLNKWTLYLLPVVKTARGSWLQGRKIRNYWETPCCFDSFHGICWQQVNIKTPAWMFVSCWCSGLDWTQHQDFLSKCNQQHHVLTVVLTVQWMNVACVMLQLYVMKYEAAAVCVCVFDLILLVVSCVWAAGQQWFISGSAVPVKIC